MHFRNSQTVRALKSSVAAIAMTVLAGCASNPQSQDTAEMVVFTPIAIWEIADRNEDSVKALFEEHGSLYRASFAASHEKIDYAGLLVQPNAGASEHELDCSGLESLNFVFVAGWNPSMRSISRLNIRYTWQHSSIEGSAGTESKVLTSSGYSFFIYDDVLERRRPTFQAPLEFAQDQLVDGTWTLTLSFRDAELHRETFELKNCTA